MKTIIAVFNDDHKLKLKQKNLKKLIVQDLMYSRVHSGDESNFINSGSQPSPDFKKWKCQNNFCPEDEPMISSTLITAIDRESKMKWKPYKNHTLKINRHQVIQIWSV